MQTQPHEAEFQETGFKWARMQRPEKSSAWQGISGRDLRRADKDNEMNR
jgi:hypothetical protein